MPTTPPLFHGLIDDAAVFPPGDAPLEEAVRLHRMHRRAPYADLVGPLLVPAAAAGALVDLVRASDEPLRVGVIARPGTPPEQLAEGLAVLAAEPLVEVGGVELGWNEGWRQQRAAGVPVAVEVGRGDAQLRTLDDLAGAEAEGVDVVAKFRTGATPQWAWPSEEELAAFIRGSLERGLPTKLTGGLHHLVRAEHDGEPQHGLLNVIAAVDAAALGGSHLTVAALLTVRSAEQLLEQVRGLDETEATLVRRCFTAYGCCDVTDPITELVDLTLLEENLRP